MAQAEVVVPVVVVVRRLPVPALVVVEHGEVEARRL